MTWILRGAGFVLMAVGLAMVMGPLAVVADVIPFVGSLVRTGSGLVAGLLSFALSMITIGIAWLAYRPLLGVGLLALSLMGFVGLRSLSSSEEEAAPVVPTPPAPPPPPPPPPTT